MGAVIMLGTLFGLIILIFGVVLRYDPEARRAPSARARPMIDELTPLLKASIGFAYVGGFAFVAIGVYLSYRHRRLHPLLLVCISAISISWIEAPYDWAVYAQFAPAIPRMPSWWPLNMTWGGLPASVPLGYIAYFVLPAVIGAALGQTVELEVPLAQADHPPHRRARRRLPLGLPLQRDPGGPARRLLLRPRDPRACAMGGDQAPVPAL